MNVNEIFNYMGKQVRVLGDTENPLFCLKDVCDILDIAVRDVVRRLEKGVVSTHPLQTKGGVQYTNFVNEDGLYDVILDSRKKTAKKFRKWITKKVLPEIRKTGGYLDSNRPEIRAMTKTSYNSLASSFDLMCSHNVIKPKEANKVLKKLNTRANELVGLPGKDRRDELNTDQLIRLNIIESSFVETINLRTKQFIYDREPIDMHDLISECVENAIKELSLRNYMDVYITTNWEE